MREHIASWATIACCRGRVKSQPKPAVNQILLGAVFVSPPAQRLVTLKPGKC